MDVMAIVVVLGLFLGAYELEGKIGLWLGWYVKEEVA